jgi:hypothetical protein
VSLVLVHMAKQQELHIRKLELVLHNRMLEPLLGQHNRKRKLLVHIHRKLELLP